MIFTIFLLDSVFVWKIFSPTWIFRGTIHILDEHNEIFRQRMLVIDGLFIENFDLRNHPFFIRTQNLQEF